MRDRTRSGIPRPIEAVVACSGLLLLAPLIALSSAAILLASGRPIFFRQQRVGRRGRPFWIYKLRTMRASRGELELTRRGDPRITAVGRLLRKTKIDELPQLWNVVKGEMSLVGPRPEVPRYVDAADPLWQEVLSVRPGITDPVTLRWIDEESVLAVGDPETLYREKLLPAKLKGYAEYLQRRSWRSDVGVLARTAAAVLGIRTSTKMPWSGEPD